MPNQEGYVLENLEGKVQHLENEVAKLIATLRVEVQRNHDDIRSLIEYLRIKFPNEWKEDGTLLMDKIKIDSG
jgi:hypothetical protein